MNSHHKYHLLKRLWTFFSLLFLMCLLGVVGKAQSRPEKPPRPISVTVITAQPLRFGTFIQNGSLGTITVTPEGTITSDGSIIRPPINSTFSPALFIVDAEPGTLITILNGTDVPLTGSNGGSMTLKVGESSTRNPFITNAKETYVYIGGTLTVRDLIANPPGAYSGTFQVTFIQE